MTIPNEERAVLVARRGHVLEVVLNRPRALNAMNATMHEMLAEAWDSFEQDDELRVAVLSGAGPRAFSVGQDLKELAEHNRNEPDATSTFGSRGKPGHPRLTERFGVTKPILAKVRGFALGGGFELALACDIIVCAVGAQFALPEARLGLVPGAGGAFRLLKQAPMRVAMGHLLTGRPMSAERAFELGLVNEVVADSDLDAAVDRWLDDILACAPLSLRTIKQVAERSQTLSVERAFAETYPEEERRRRSDDAREGAQAFVEKRPPVWKGR